MVEGLAVRRLCSLNRQKLPYIETKIAQPPKQVHRSPMWHMKGNGQHYLFVKGSLLVEVLVRALEAVKLGENFRTKLYLDRVTPVVPSLVEVNH